MFVSPSQNLWKTVGDVGRHANTHTHSIDWWTTPALTAGNTEARETEGGGGKEERRLCALQNGKEGWKRSKVEEED